MSARGRFRFGRRSGDGARGSVDGAVRAGGRVALWVLIAVVLVRGVGAILSGNHPEAGSGQSSVRVERFPDGEARAFAVRFVSAYLDGSRGDVRSGSVGEFLAEGLSDSAGEFAPRRGPGAQVAWAMVAREVPLGGSRALLTVAVLLVDGRTRYVTVPVAGDERGGLAVFEPPSFSPPPPRGAVDARQPAPLSGASAEAIVDLTSRFLRSYLSGASAAALEYFQAPGTRLAPMTDGLEVVSIDRVDGLGPPGARGRRRAVLAAVQVRERATGTVYALAYRVTVVRRDRWQVAGVAGGPAT